jgi:hypothetical protein
MMMNMYMYMKLQERANLYICKFIFLSYLRDTFTLMALFVTTRDSLLEEKKIESVQGLKYYWFTLKCAIF